jgi:hypothetical protein
MADLLSPSAGGSSGDELENLLLAELEEQAELAAATAAPLEAEEKTAQPPKRQKIAGGMSSFYFLFKFK